MRKCAKCGRGYTYHIERWGEAWKTASIPLEWHLFVEIKEEEEQHD